jgi:dihydroxyacetone kinase
LNGPGFSITLCNITRAASASSSTTSELLGLLSAPTTAPSWPNVLSNTSTKVARKETLASNGVSKRQKLTESQDIKSKPDTLRRSSLPANYYCYDIVDPSTLERIIRTACEKAIAAEPNLTKWDMVLGDGDCGEAVFSVSTGMANL